MTRYPCAKQEVTRRRVAFCRLPTRHEGQCDPVHPDVLREEWGEAS